MEDPVVLEILQGLNASRDVTASAVVSIDGLCIASSFPQVDNEDRISAMTAAMVSLGERAAKDVLKGNLDHSIVHTDNGYMLFFAATSDILLVLTTPKGAKLGLVLFDAKKTLRELVAYYTK